MKTNRRALLKSSVFLSAPCFGFEVSEGPRYTGYPDFHPRHQYAGLIRYSDSDISLYRTFEEAIQPTVMEAVQAASFVVPVRFDLGLMHLMPSDPDMSDPLNHSGFIGWKYRPGARRTPLRADVNPKHRVVWNLFYSYWDALRNEE